MQAPREIVARSGSHTLYAYFLDNGSDRNLVLLPGSYTVQVSGVGGTTGVALVEVYEVP